MSVFTKWRAPTRAEFPVGMSELAKHIGERESVDPTWTRRLAIAEPGGQWCLVIDECCGNLPPYDPGYTTAYACAYPLEEGSRLLQDPARNPEVELARRRQEAKERAEQKEKEQAARIEAEKRRRMEEEQLAEDKGRFRASDWEKLAEWRRAFYTLALNLKSRDPELAADLHAIAEKGGWLDFPRTRWWT